MKSLSHTRLLWIVGLTRISAMINPNDDDDQFKYYESDASTRLGKQSAIICNK